MFCPFCSNQETKVLESRISDDSLRRRRECLSCNNRFTTYEKAAFQLTVTKKNNKEEPFQLQKVVESIKRACNKIEPETVLALSKKVEQKIIKKKLSSIKTTDIGKIVLTELKKFDKIAYLRFASIHKGIEDPKLLEKEINLIM
jgi:transcriptional repressor NrdR